MILGDSSGADLGIAYAVSPVGFSFYTPFFYAFHLWALLLQASKSWSPALLLCGQLAGCFEFETAADIPIRHSPSLELLKHRCREAIDAPSKPPFLGVGSCHL